MSSLTVEQLIQLRQRFAKYKNALATFRTSESVARRRQIGDADADCPFIDSINPYLADLQKILQAKASRRAQAKTQVQTARVNEHIRTRAGHTLEVQSIAIFLADLLGLNPWLAQAIAAGHDIGHTPFGHVGETFLTGKLQALPAYQGKRFKHDVFGVIVAQKIERRGKGLNLPRQTLDGILNHSRGSGKASLNDQVSFEANLVMYADKIAYVFADWNDLFTRNVLNIVDYPDLGRLIDFCGNSQRERMWYMIGGLCRESASEGKISFSHCEEAKVFEQIKAEMYQIYEHVNLFESEAILERVYCFLEHINFGEQNPALVMALMTDKDVLHLYERNLLNIADIRETSVWELLSFLRQLKDLDLCDPDLDW